MSFKIPLKNLVWSTRIGRIVWQIYCAGAVIIWTNRSYLNLTCSLSSYSPVHFPRTYCIYMSRVDICEEKDIQTYELVRAHNTQMTRQSLFSDSSYRQWDGRFVHSESHNGLVCVCNMKDCVLGSDSMLWEHILLFNSWSSRSRSCDHALLPCFQSISEVADSVLEIEVSRTGSLKNPGWCMQRRKSRR